MSPTLMKRFIRLQTAKEIWDAVSKTFYYGSDETQLFELNWKSFTTRHNDRPLPTYYNELIGIFQEIDAQMSAQGEDINMVVSLHKHMKHIFS